MSAGARDARPVQELRRARRRQRHRFPPRAGRAARADRPERRRQDDLRQSGDRRARAQRRAHPARRRRRHRAAAGAARQARPRPHLSDQHAVPRPERAGERLPRRRRAARRRRRYATAPAGSRRDVIDEAYALLERLGIADDALRLVRELPYGRQRLVEIAIALGLEPKVLLLDEPAAGVPSTESGIIVDIIESLPADIAVLIIEHDMDLVFRLARRITVLVQGAILVEGTPRGDRRRSARARGLSRRRRARMSDALGIVLEGVRAGYGETVVLDGVSLTLPAAARSPCSAATASARRRCSRPSWATRRCMAAASVSAAREIEPHGAASARARRHRLRPAGARDLPLAHASTRTSPWRRGRDAGRAARIYDLFPSLAERRRNCGNQLSGGEQQMLAIGRALMGNPAAAAAWTSRSKAWRR